eukprot:gene1740-4854_t
MQREEKHVTTKPRELQNQLAPTYSLTTAPATELTLQRDANWNKLATQLQLEQCDTNSN